VAQEPQLHFYPGDKRVIFYAKGRPLVDAEAWGGPAREQPRFGTQKYAAVPTEAGRFVIFGIVKYRTSSWEKSNIPWGARLKINPLDFNDLVYEDNLGKWHSVRQATTGPSIPRGLSRGDVQREYFLRYGDDMPPKMWLFNDFGPKAIRYFKDKNHNRRLDKDQGEALMGEMFHTTPGNEAEAFKFKAAHPHSDAPPPATMDESHGCIHLKPYDRDKLQAAGAFKPGTTLIIHEYDEHVPR
jgi:hypothetical protein